MNTLAFMEQERTYDVDVIEEMRMRCWARRHYTTQEDRSKSLHPVVLDEMRCIDQELKKLRERRN